VRGPLRLFLVSNLPGIRAALAGSDMVLWSGVRRGRPLHFFECVQNFCGCLYANRPIIYSQPRVRRRVIQALVYIKAGNWLMLGALVSEDIFLIDIVRLSLAKFWRVARLWDWGCALLAPWHGFTE